VETSVVNLREFVDELRQEWKLMWYSRIEDKVRAEEIADKNYERLFVDRGLVLLATRKCKPPEFHEIVEKHLSPIDAERFNPTPVRGGVRKFIKEYITVKDKSRAQLKEETRAALEGIKSHQQLKHGGRGWLNISLKASGQ